MTEYVCVRELVWKKAIVRGLKDLIHRCLGPSEPAAVSGSIGFVEGGHNIRCVQRRSDSAAAVGDLPSRVDPSRFRDLDGETGIRRGGIGIDVPVDSCGVGTSKVWE